MLFLFDKPINFINENYHHGVITRLIERNTTIPTKKSQTFTTAADSQTSVDIHVLQSEREMASDNTTLGRFQLTRIPSAPRGVPQIEVTFDIDANGIVNVSAKDLGSGKKQKITITASTKLSEDEINEKIKEAEKFAEEDKKKKEVIEVKNNAESLIYQTEKSLKDLGDKVTEDEKNNINSKMDELKKLLEGEDTSAIKSKTDELTQDFYKISQNLYDANNGEGQSSNESQENNKNDDVVDGDYEVVDENDQK